MRLAELAIARNIVAESAGELGRDLMDDRVPAVRARLIDQRAYLRQRALSLGGATRLPGAEQGLGARQERVHLEQSAPAPAGLRQRLIRHLEGGPTVVATEHDLCQEANRPGRDSEADAALSSSGERASLGFLGRA